MINEIMYQPASAGSEFLEIHNRSVTTAFDLGESFKLALLSTPEGEDKPGPVSGAGVSPII